MITKKLSKKPRQQRAKPGCRVWVTRGMTEDHYNRLRILAAHMPKVGREATMEAAHTLVMERGLRLIEQQVIK